MTRLAGKKGQDVNTFEVKELIGEYDFVMKQMFQMPDVSAMMLELASSYQTDKAIQSAQDSIYGEGVTEFIGKAMEAFYKKK